MSILIEKLYNEADYDTDLAIFKTIVPYFKSKKSFYTLSLSNSDFPEYEKLNDRWKKRYK